MRGMPEYNKVGEESKRFCFVFVFFVFDLAEEFCFGFENQIEMYNDKYNE
jgi:hypothetical protein